MKTKDQLNSMPDGILSDEELEKVTGGNDETFHMLDDEFYKACMSKDIHTADAIKEKLAYCKGEASVYLRVGYLTQFEYDELMRMYEHYYDEFLAMHGLQ